MNHFYHYQIKDKRNTLAFKLILLLLCGLPFLSKDANAQIYKHDFGVATITAIPYVDPPVIIDPNLSGSSWTNSTGAWTSFAGFTGEAISLNNSGGTPTITLSLNIAAGYQANVTGFSFWRRRSTTGAQNWSMTINGIFVGSGTVPTTGAIVSSLVSNAVNNQTGTLTVVISLSAATGTGTFRLDEFTLNGSVVPAPTLSANSLTSFGNVCTSSTAGANQFTITGTTLTVANVTVGPLTGFTFSSDNVTFLPSLSLVHAAGPYSQNIYVQFSPALVQSYSGNIPVGGGGAPTINVAAVGIGVNTIPSITNGTVGGVTTNAANVSATISANGCTAVSAYGVEYSTTPGFANGSGTAVAGGVLVAGSFTSNLITLAPPGQTYYFHTYATNAGGTAYGIEGSFTLLNLTATLSVPGSGAGSLNPFGNICINTSLVNSFNLSGSVLNGTNITIGPLSNYTFSTSAGGTYTNTLTLVNGGAGYSYAAGVLSATIYVKFIPTAVAAYNGNIGVSGGGAASINVAATGSGINDAPTVTTNAAIFVTTSSATLPGTIVDAGCGVTLGYGIEYSTVPFAPGAGTQVPASNLAAGNFSINLTGLPSNTTYYFYAYATNAGGTTYGLSNNFTTFTVPTKLVILSVTPASPTALAPFSVTIQAQDALGNPVDVDTDTDIQFTQFAGAGTFTFPNLNAPAATMFASTNTITITDLYYDQVENNVGITALASAGMTLTASPAFIFNVVAYVGPNTFIWGTTGSSSWFVGSGAQHWVDPTFVTTAVPPGISGAANTNLALFTSYAALINTGILGMNFTTVGGDYNVGSIVFNETYATTHLGNTVTLGNSSGSLNGVLSLYGVNYNNLGGIAGNNFTSLLLGNYMSSPTSKTFQIVNNVSGVQTFTLNLPVAGSIVAGVGNIINLNTLITGTQALQFSGGGTFVLAPASITNTYSGAITVTKGTLVTGNTGAFSTVSPNIITLGTNAATTGILRLNGSSVTIGGLSSTGVNGTAIVDNGNAAATLTINNTANYSFLGGLKDGTIGSLSLIKTGTGTITLTGTSTLTGTTIINNGKLVLNKTGGGTYPSLGVITVNGPGALQISKDQTIKDLNLAGGGILIVDAGVTLTITGNYNAATCTINNLGTIRLQGTALQTFPGTAATMTNMNNLTVNNIFGVNLNNSLNIAGTLNLNAGIFTVGAYTLTLNNPITGNLANFAANNTSSIVIAGTAAGVNIPASVTQLKNLTVSNTVGSTLQGNLNVSTTLFISAGTLADNQYVLNGNANVTMTGGVLNLEQNTAILPGLTGVYSLTGGTVQFNGVGLGSDAQTVRPVNYFNITSSATGDRILSATGIIGVSNIFTPNLPNNVYTVTNSTVDYNKTSAQSIAGFGYYNMTVSGGGAITKTLSGNIDVQGTLSLASNTKLALANFNTTLKSNATNTANVAIINTANSITYGTGRFIVERYIPTGVSHGKTWQLLAVPVSGTQSVKAAWQENNAPLVTGTAGFGTTITSEKPGAVSRGYDFYTAVAPSIKTFNAATNAWVGIDDGSTATSVLPIANKKGYFIFVRGDRTVQSSAAAANQTTLRTSGKLFSPGTDAPPSSTVLAAKFESVGNPYASSIDFTSVLSTSTGIDSKYYVWDPLLAGTNGYGGYQLLSSSNLWKPVPGGTTNYPTGVAYTKVQSGQAILVYSTGGGTVNFTEANKVSGNSLLFRTGLNTSGSFFRSSLMDASGTLIDGNVVAFNNSFSNSFDEDDALKLEAAIENIGISSQGKVLALEARKTLVNSDTIFYKMGNLKIRNYQFNFAPESMDAGSLTAYLIDRFTGTTTPIGLATETQYHFTVSNDPASKAADRFYVVFKPSTVVPISIVKVSAVRKNSSDVQVMWDLEQENNVDHYEIERSSTGQNFTSVLTSMPTQNNGARVSYSIIDPKAPEGDIYYRIKLVKINGDHQFSAIVKLVAVQHMAGINIYPNPVIDKTMNISFIDQPVGIYTIRLSNALGQVVYHSSVKINNNATTCSFMLGNEISAGVYQLEVNAGKHQLTKQVLVK